MNTRESKHAGGSRRLRNGDSILTFDGEGLVARCVITHLDPRGRSTAFSIEQRTAFAKPEYQVGLACAVPKGDRQNTLLDMTIQAGMTDYWPVRFERSVTKAPELSERWQRIAVEACKQSRRAWLPRLHEPLEFADLIELAQSWALVVADAADSSAGVPAASTNSGSLLVVGPEGGLTQREKQALLDAEARVINLGPHILRTETAAVAGTVSLMREQVSNPS